MSGHNKWSSIKHKKGAADAKRGKIFSKIAKEITVAAKAGGGDPNANASLRLFIQKAKENNMPADNIKRAIQRGTGEIPGVVYEEKIYEGYGPGGVALLIYTLSDNKNRTSSEVRSTLDKNGGNLANPGAVSYIFGKKGYLAVLKSECEEDKLMDIVLSAGAEDLITSEEVYEIYTDPGDFEVVQKAVTDAGISYEQAEITMIPSTTVDIAGGDAKRALSLVELLEDLDDVQSVHSNFNITDDSAD